VSYQSIVDMAQSESLLNRIAAAAAQEGWQGDPRQFAMNRRWEFAKDSGWVAAWDYACGEYNVNQNPDTGARTDVISDAMILAAVQPLVNPS
jgi:hypothetical protein